jgi:transketolase
VSSDTPQHRPLSQTDVVALVRDRARFSRAETVRLISIAKTGHYASAFSSAEILATLCYAIMRVRPREPLWPERDRLLLGKGHAAVALYPLLADLGFFSAGLLEDYTRLGSPFGDHPDMRRIPGIDFSSGSLGHALSIGLGITLGGRLSGLEFNTFVLLGDGELHEGQVWEAALAAAHYRASRLIAIVDRNEYSLDGRVEDIIALEPLSDKWRAFGWDTREVDGHDVEQLLAVLRALSRDVQRERPAVIIAHTVKGKGVSFMESQIGWHLGFLAEPDRRSALEEIYEGVAP